MVGGNPSSAIAVDITNLVVAVFDLDGCNGGNRYAYSWHFTEDGDSVHSLFDGRILSGPVLSNGVVGMKKSGYTLLELVVVLGILGILLSVVLLRQVQIKDRELDDMLEDLRFARTYAVTYGEEVKVSFDLAGDSYSITNAGSEVLLSKQLQKVDLRSFHHIGATVGIKPTGAFSKCGHIELSHAGKSYKLNFTVGIARFTLVAP